jgi:gas vesicle protein
MGDTEMNDMTTKNNDQISADVNPPSSSTGVSQMDATSAAQSSAASVTTVSQTTATIPVTATTSAMDASANTAQSVPEMFQAIMTAISQSKNDIKEEVRTEVKAGFDNRFDEVEDDVATLQHTTSIAVRKITVLENRAATTEAVVKNIDQRVEALETGAGPAPKDMSLNAVLQRETDRVRSLLDEAKAYQRVAVVGCHGRREPSRQAIARLINENSSGLEVRFDVRGLVARITFLDDGKLPPATRAKNFVDDINSRQAAAVFWAKVDEPRMLRDLKARARGFGEAVAERCSMRRPGGEPVRYSFVDGFLVVGDVVVGPLTMIPAEDDRDEALQLVTKIICHPQHRPCDYKVPIEKQMRRSISTVLHKIHNKPAFIDTAEEVLGDETSDIESPPATGAVAGGASKVKSNARRTSSSSATSSSDSESPSPTVTAASASASASASDAQHVSPGFGFLKLGVENLGRDRGQKRKKREKKETSASKAAPPPRKKAAAVNDKKGSARSHKRPRRSTGILPFT